VAYFLKTGTVELEEQPLLANGSEITLFLGNGLCSVARQQILNNAVVGLQQWKTVFCVVLVEML
jgi:hypothetical protein